MAGCLGEAQSRKDRRVKMSDKDLSGVLQAVIDAPQLERYYHSDVAGRTPLVLVAPNAGKPDLRKFGQAVVISDQPAKDKPFLEITRIVPTSDHCTVEFRYPVEGLKGKFDLSKQGDKWVVQKHEFREQ
jgi:hypothetical protein